MELRMTDIKQQNKNINRLTFVFEHVNNTRRKHEAKRMCFNGITCRGTHQVKKSKNCNAHRSFSVLIHNIIYYVYECFGQYCKLACIITRGRNFRKYDWFPVDSAQRNSCAQIPLIKHGKKCKDK